MTKMTAAIAAVPGWLWAVIAAVATAVVIWFIYRWRTPKADRRAVKGRYLCSLILVAISVATSAGGMWFILEATNPDPNSWQFIANLATCAFAGMLIFLAAMLAKSPGIISVAVIAPLFVASSFTGAMFNYTQWGAIAGSSEQRKAENNRREVVTENAQSNAETLRAAVKSTTDAAKTAQEAVTAQQQIIAEIQARLQNPSGVSDRVSALDGQIEEQRGLIIEMEAVMRCERGSGVEACVGYDGEPVTVFSRCANGRCTGTGFNSALNDRDAARRQMAILHDQRNRALAMSSRFIVEINAELSDAREELTRLRADADARAQQASDARRDLAGATLTVESNAGQETTNRAERAFEFAKRAVGGGMLAAGADIVTDADVVWWLSWIAQLLLDSVAIAFSWATSSRARTGRSWEFLGRDGEIAWLSTLYSKGEAEARALRAAWPERQKAARMAEADATAASVSSKPIACQTPQADPEAEARRKAECRRRASNGGSTPKGKGRGKKRALGSAGNRGAVQQAVDNQGKNPVQVHGPKRAAS